MSELTDTQLIAFKAVSNFIKELSSIFGKKQRSLALYRRLIEKTTLSHEDSIRKHLDVFRRFCISNREALETKDWRKFQVDTITYSERVYIGLKGIFSMADDETKAVIWKHLLTISAILDPNSKARDILRESSGPESKNEQEFLGNIFDKVQDCVDPVNMTNPMQAISSILSSGVFSELVNDMSSGVNSGELKLDRLMGTVQGMMSQMSQMNGEGGEESQAMMVNINSMMGGLMNMNLSDLQNNTRVAQVEEVQEEEKSSEE